MALGSRLHAWGRLLVRERKERCMLHAIVVIQRAFRASQVRTHPLPS